MFRFVFAYICILTCTQSIFGDVLHALSERQTASINAEGYDYAPPGNAITSERLLAPEASVATYSSSRLRPISKTLRPDDRNDVIAYQQYNSAPLTNDAYSSRLVAGRSNEAEQIENNGYTYNSQILAPLVRAGSNGDSAFRYVSQTSPPLVTGRSYENRRKAGNALSYSSQRSEPLVIENGQTQNAAYSYDSQKSNGNSAFRYASQTSPPLVTGRSYENRRKAGNALSYSSQRSEPLVIEGAFENRQTQNAAYSYDSQKSAPFVTGGSYENRRKASNVISLSSQRSDPLDIGGVFVNGQTQNSDYSYDPERSAPGSYKNGPNISQGSASLVTGGSYKSGQIRDNSNSYALQKSTPFVSSTPHIPALYSAPLSSPKISSAGYNIKAW